MGGCSSKKTGFPGEDTIIVSPEDLRKRQDERNRRRDPIMLPNDDSFTFSRNGRNGWKVTDVYDLSTELGKGAFGHVYKANHRHIENGSGRRDWQNVAVKTTSPSVLDRRGGVQIYQYDHVESYCQEVKALMRLREENIHSSCCLYLYEYFWEFDPGRGTGKVHLVSELLGQELEHWRQSQEIFKESTAKMIASVLLNALDFMHERKVVHRDLKLQNVMFRVNGDFKTLKLVDFGLAKVLDDDTPLSDFCGSLGYISPEIYENQPYRFEGDLFSFGVILFRLLSGTRPFSSINAEKLKRDTTNLSYKIDGKNWETVSGDALKLVRKLLIGKDQRLTAAEAANHEWFVSRRDSILKSDFGQSLAYVDDGEHSKAVVLTQAPPTNPETTNDNRFQLDSDLESALDALQKRKLYAGQIVESASDRNAGLLCVEEYVPKGAKVLPVYIAQLNGYSEKECRRIFREVARIVRIAHTNRMSHRNIHVSNFLVDASGRVLVRGLQYAQTANDDQPLTGHFGYLYNWFAFKAPEIDSEFFHEKSVDLWSLGALLYMLLTALPPFRGDGVELVRNKHSGTVVFDMIIPSTEAQALVRELLQVNSRNRPSIEAVHHSKWMLQSDDVLAEHDLSLTHTFFQDWESRSPSN